MTSLTPRPRRSTGWLLTVIAAASIVVALGWLVGHAAGVTYLISTPLGTRRITLMLAVAGTSMSGLAGWTALGYLQRRTFRARAVWIRLALGVVVLSLIPIWTLHAMAGTRLSLTALHLLAAAVLIPGLLHTTTHVPATSTRIDHVHTR